MNIYLRNLFIYFENVLHPAGSNSENDPAKTKRKSKANNNVNFASPESINIRGGVAKKQEKQRLNPAP